MAETITFRTGAATEHALGVLTRGGTFTRGGMLTRSCVSRLAAIRETVPVPVAEWHAVLGPAVVREAVPVPVAGRERAAGLPSAVLAVGLRADAPA